MRRVFAFAALIALTLAWAVAPVSATTIEKFHGTQTTFDDDWSCGHPMAVTGRATHTIVVRGDMQKDFVYVTDAHAVKQVWTARDGRSFTLAESGVTKDVAGRRISRTVYEFAWHDSGAAMTITDSSGRIVVRDRGTVSFRYTVDFATGEFTFLDLRFSGPHATDGDLCRAVAPLVGTGSSRYLTARPIGSTTFPMGFYEYLPPSYSASGNPSPLLVALNGFGENGDGTPDALGLLVGTGIPRFIDIDGWPTDRTFVVLALQHARANESEEACTTADEVHSFIEYAVEHYNVDPHRVYVTGLSCGAIGTWNYLAAYLGQQVAAAVPIAGDGRDAWAAAGCKLGAVPIWAFHGALDDTVDPAGSIAPMTALQACKGVTDERAKLTIYPDLGHDSWSAAYSGQFGDDIYGWMLGFTRP